MNVNDRHVDALVGHLVARDTVSANELCLDLLDSGVPIGRLLVDLIGPAQEHVGRLWHRNEATVADEHSATAIADQLVASLTAIRHPNPEGPHVVLACAEGEWHVLSARLLGEVLRAEGLHVSFLGPSMPARQLRAFIDRVHPDVLAVSCSTSLSLDGVISFVHVAHEVGIPVLAGGRAIPTERRARTLGADLWAADPAGAAALLRRPLPTHLAEPTADTGGAIAVGLGRTEWIDQAMVELGTLFPGLARYRPDQIDRTREDFDSIISFIQAATLVRDDGLFHEFVLWLRSLLEARGVPAIALALSLQALRQARAGHDSVVRLLTDASASVTP